jgi:hypothetical protein
MASGIGLPFGYFKFAASRWRLALANAKILIQLHTFWCIIWVKKNSRFGPKYRKQRTGNFLAS